MPKQTLLIQVWATFVKFLVTTNCQCCSKTTLFRATL